MPADNSWQAVPAGQFAAGTVSADNFALEIQQAGFLLRIDMAGSLAVTGRLFQLLLFDPYPKPEINQLFLNKRQLS